MAGTGARWNIISHGLNELIVAADRLAAMMTTRCVRRDLLVAKRAPWPVRLGEPLGAVDGFFAASEHSVLFALIYSPRWW